MIRFLRRYAKVLLAVLGSMLMVAFLAPQAIQRFGSSPTKRVIARMGDAPVTAAMFDKSQREIQILSQLHEQIMPVLGVSDDDAVGHWLMLSKLARENGFVGGQQDGQAFESTFTEDIARSSAIQFAQYYSQAGFQRSYDDVYKDIVTQTLQRFRNGRSDLLRRGFTPETIDRALATAAGVNRMLGAYLNSFQPSTPEAVAEARRFWDAVRVDYTLIPAISFSAEAPLPTDEELQAHFQQYRNLRDGEGEHRFGYMLEPAIEVEYLQINREAIKSSIEIDPVEVAAEYNRNRGRYAGEFQEMKAQVEEQLRNKATDQAMRDAERIATREFLKREDKLPSDQGFRVVPADWPINRPSFETVMNALATQLKEKYNVPTAAFVTVQHRLSTMDAIPISMQVLGDTRRDIGPNSVPFAVLAFSAKELDSESPYGLQAGIVAKPTQNPAGDLFFWRVNRVRREGPPDSVAQVRNDLITDLKRLAGYELMLEQIEELRQEATYAEDLDAFAQNYFAVAVKDVEVRRSGAMMSDGQPALEDFNDQEVRDVLLDHAQTLDPTVGAFNSLDDLNLAIPLPDSLSLAIVRINSLEPLDIESYRRVVPNVIFSAKQAFVGAEDWPFSFETLSERLGYVSIDRDDDLPASDEAAGESEEKPTQAGL